MRYGRNTRRTAVDPRALRLEPGSHSSPRDGVCILELASVVAREKFSDRPDCVCRVIAAFLRGWNDRSSHTERQRLRPYAQRVVRSRAGRSVTGRRRDVCLTWAGADLTGRPLSRALARATMRLRVLALCGVGPAVRFNEGAGELAARTVFSRYDPETAFAVVDALLAVGSRPSPPAAAANGGAKPSLNGSFPAADGELARALVERELRESGNGMRKNGDPSREPARVA